MGMDTRIKGDRFRLLATCLAGLLLLAAALYLMNPQVLAKALESRPQAPEFTQTESREWINSEPLTWADLRGQVVLVDFWTFMCWNCYRSFPWLTSMEERLADEDFSVIGIHTPEFDAERDHARIAERAEHFGLHHPIMVDNDHAYWRAMGNRYWPAFYLIDKRGRVRDYFIGETHEGDARAREIEARIGELLAESAG